MKTSNKILLILLANLLLIPAALMLALSAKVQSGNYVIGMTEHEKQARALKPITNADFVKISAPEGAKLECTIHYSDSVYYRKYGSNENSLQVERNGDTLHFSVNKKSGETEQGDIYLDLFIPFRGLLMLDGANARLEKVEEDADIRVQADNNSSFILGKFNEREYTPLKFSSLFVAGNNSTITIPKGTALGKLELDLGGKSKLFMGEDLSITELLGQISAETTLSGAAKWLYQLKTKP